MTIHTLRNGLLSLGLLACLAGPAGAQGAPGAAPQAAPAPAPAGVTLTPETLKTTLEAMGYETKDLGAKSYQVTIQHGGNTYYLKLSLSGSGQKLWICSYFGEIADIGKVPGHVLARLLAVPATEGPMHFYLRDTAQAQKKQLLAGLPVDNRALTPSILRKQIENFCQGLDRTQGAWDMSKWSAAPALAAAPKPAPAPEAKKPDPGMGEIR